MSTANPSSQCACSKTALTVRNKTINRTRSFGDMVKLILTSIAFAAIPKCPLCLAGYIAVGTGIGLSFTVASYLRTVLIIVCILSFAWFITKHLSRFLYSGSNRK